MGSSSVILLAVLLPASKTHRGIVVNPDHHICTLTVDVPFHAEMTVKQGRGYATVNDNRGSEQELGVIAIDSVYSPVLRVRYRTENMRVGQRTNYDRLILEIWTKGSVTPEDALVEASLILRKHLNPFVMYHELGLDVVSSPGPRVDVPMPKDAALKELLDRPVNMLNLCVRASNCLEAARVTTLRDLVVKSEGDLLRIRSFGKTSLHEVQRKLADVGLALGMKVLEDGSLVFPSADAPSEPSNQWGSDGDSGSPADGSMKSDSGQMEGHVEGHMEVFTMGE